MSYKIKNIALLTLSCLLLMEAKGVMAQGVVSLSEEAMFDDVLETNQDFPATSSATAQQPSAPASDKQIPDANESSDEEKTEQAGQPSVADSSTTQPDELPILAVTSQKSDAPVVKPSKSLDSLSSTSATKVDDLFSQMSDIERKTALLNLELRREKLQNEIEAVKNQRRQAMEQEKLKAEEQKQKMLEKAQEEERKKREEQQRLRELDISFEKIRQEKVLKAYKNQMLEETQKWIAHDAMFYKTINDLRAEKKALSDSYKEKFLSLQKVADEAYNAYTKKLDEHSNEVQNLNSQIDVLRSRISSLEQEAEERARNANPFAVDGANAGDDTSAVTSFNSEASGEVASAASEPISNPLAKDYAVTEIRGQGGELIAKLINRNGLAFYVKKGTALQSGHVVSEITSTYVAADKNFKKDYIYFSAGGILPEEIDAFEIEKADNDEQ